MERLRRQDHRNVVALWKEYFRDPSQWWDNRINKFSERSPDFKHKVSREPLWIDCRHNPPWIHEKLKMLPSSFSAEIEEENDGEVANYDSAAVVAMLKTCANQKDLHKGAILHAAILDKRLHETSPSVASALVNMFAKCGALTKAQEVLDGLRVQSVVSWNALIAGLAQQGFAEEAIDCFEQMQDKGLSPNAVTFTCILKAYGSVGALYKGIELHAEIARQGLLHKDIVLGTGLVNMYAKCKALAKARIVLNELPVRTAVSWNALISGYVQQEDAKEALKCYKQMLREGLSPDAVTFTCILKACGSIGASKIGKNIHTEIDRQGLLRKDLVLGNALVDMYAKCGVFAKARQVLFEELPARGVVSWSALLAGYAQHGHDEEALHCIQEMQHEGFSPNEITFACVLKACGSLKALDKGKQIHDAVVKQGLLAGSSILGGALVDMYAKCGAIAKAHEVHDGLSTRNVVSWSALIAGYAQQGHGEEALSCFTQMQDEGFSPDAVTYCCVLKACGSIQAAEKGQEIHAEIDRQRLLEGNVVLGGALVDMYAKCNLAEKAQDVLEELHVRDALTWNVLIQGYAQDGKGEAALKCYEKMYSEGLSPDTVTFACVLKACGSLGATERGIQIHAEIARLGLFGGDVVVGNALIDMYGKCGALTKAEQVISELPVRDVVSWSALLAGYAQHGHTEEALDCFEQMQREGCSPDGITFGCVLNACSHSGLVAEGEMYFSDMTTKYEITPNLEHHACMVDLYGRAGHFDEAVAVLKKMPSDHVPAWSALLGACRKWKNVELGLWAFEHMVELEKKDAAAYVCMSNIFADAGMKEEADRVEAMRVRNEAWKKPGCTWWTDVGGNVHRFGEGDKKHPQRERIYAKLQELFFKISQEDYSPSLNWVSQDTSDDAKKDLLCEHSEKLAVAWALISTPKGVPIRVVKNLRMCGDCHDSMSLISKIEKRTIQVRDANRTHAFEDGRCSCGGYW